MRSLKFIGIELKSMPQLSILLFSTPAILAYLIWDRLTSATINVSSYVSLVSTSYNIQNGMLLNITKKAGIFMNFNVAQWKAFYNAVSTAILFDFIVGGLLGAFIIGAPIVRGTIINDIATLGSKRKALAARILFVILCASLFAGFSAIFLCYLPPLFGVSPGIRFSLAVFSTSLLTMLSAFIIVLLLTTLSKDLIVPVAGIFIILILSFDNVNLGHLLLPFKDLTFVLWNSSKFGHPGNYMLAGIILYGLLTALAVKTFEGGDYY